MGESVADLLGNELVVEALSLLALALGALLAYLAARRVLVSGIRRLAQKSNVTWDDALVEARVFGRMAHIAPALVAYYGVQFVPELHETTLVLVQRVSVSLMVAVTAISANALLDAVNDIYSRNPEYRRRPIKGYLQVVKIILYLIAALVVVATLLDRSPWLFISGIGAMTAVLLLIFKDTILSLVASVQIASNDMIHVGDWIEMPQAGADGDVIDVALHTVKVQNWDMTISTIPTHQFIEQSFKNWRGMSNSGGRRIKRSLRLDMNSVRFLEPEEVERFGGWALLRDYIARKRSELAAYNAREDRDASVNADIRRLTNVGTFRSYVLEYLKAHPKIHHSGYTLLVRQLAPGEAGLPIEIYCFSNDQDWGRYEAIQADIFDHLLAIVPEFGLRLHQSPTGQDLERVGANPRAS